MTTLQEDILEIYNSLVIFSDDIIKSDFPKAITVKYEEDSRLLVFSLGGKSARLWTPYYYSLDLEELKKPSYLLPKDYDDLMYSLQTVINSGNLIKERTVLSPENLGFDLYWTDPKNPSAGLELKSRIRFVSGVSWFFRLKTRIYYGLENKD